MTDRDDDLVATASQTVGPFFDFGLTTPNAALGQMAGPDTPGERIRLRIRVYDGDGAVVPDAVVELWQADAGGAFPGVCGAGRAPTADGECEFHTVRPGAAEGASHINVCLFARGLLRHIFTRIYFAGDPALCRRPRAGAGARGAPRRRCWRTSDGDTWVFDLRLQGERETVFFDL